MIVSSWGQRQMLNLPVRQRCKCMKVNVSYHVAYTRLQLLSVSFWFCLTGLHFWSNSRLDSVPQITGAAFLPVQRTWPFPSTNKQCQSVNKNWPQSGKVTNWTFTFWSTIWHLTERTSHLWYQYACCLYSTSTLWVNKKQAAIILTITSPNVDRFSKFFHWQIH